MSQKYWQLHGLRLDDSFGDQINRKLVPSNNTSQKTAKKPIDIPLESINLQEN